MDHVVELGDLAILVGNDREVDADALGLLDVSGPLFMVVEVVHRQADDLDAALVPLGLEACYFAQLGGAHRGEVLGMGEQDAPAVAQPLVEVDVALSGFLGEVGSGVAETEAHGFLALDRRRGFGGD